MKNRTRTRRTKDSLLASQNETLKPVSTVGDGISEGFFDNLPSLLGAEQVASLLNFSVTTIYDWRYRARQKNVPKDLFLKFNRKLFIKTEALKRWIISQNPSLT